MKESKFIDQNKDKWNGFERLLNADVKDPDKLSEFFINITDDLSYARTFFNNRSIRVYLNNICQQLFYLIYKSPKRRAQKTIATFWKYELPTIAYESRRELIASLLIFLTAVGIGVISSVHDPEFFRTILGSDYVEMTIENIESGDPMAVYKKMNEVDMFLGITLNNLLVSVRTFLMGILWAAGSIIIILYNGIMVGSFQYFFIEKGLFVESFLTIWMHGAIEISCIVIAGASGIVLGKGIIAPGSYTRLQAFQIAAKRGAKLFLGIVPLIVMAALIESFLTRYTELPDFLRFTLILMSFSFMFFYFWWYPRLVVKSGKAVYQDVSDLQSSPNLLIQYKGLIKTGGDILRDTFLFYRKYGSRILTINFYFGLAYVAIVAFIIFPNQYDYPYYYNYMDWVVEMSGHFFDYENKPHLLPINTLFFALHGVLMIRLLFFDVNGEKLNRRMSLTLLAYSLIINLILNSTALVNVVLQSFISFFVSPLITILLFTLIHERKGGATLFKRVRYLIGSKYGFLLGLSFLITLISIAGYLFLSTPFPLFYLEFVNWNLQLDHEVMNTVAILTNSFLSMFTMLLTVPIYIIGVSICYFTLREIQEAEGLRADTEKFGK